MIHRQSLVVTIVAILSAGAGCSPAGQPPEHHGVIKSLPPVTASSMEIDSNRMSTSRPRVSVRPTGESEPRPSRTPTPRRTATSERSATPADFAAPVVSLDDAISTVVAELDPILSPTVELAGSVRSTVVVERREWMQHGGPMGPEQSLASWFPFNTRLQSPEEIIEDRMLAPLVHVVVLGIEDPQVHPDSTRRWSGCPLGIDRDRARAAFVAFIDGDRGWPQVTAISCPGSLDAVVAEMSAIPTAVFRAATAGSVPTATATPTPGRQPSSPRQLRAPPTPSPIRASREEIADGLDPGARAALRYFPWLPGARWRYNSRSRYFAIGELPRSRRAEVELEVADVWTDGQGGMVAEIDERVTAIHGEKRSLRDEIPFRWRVDSGAVAAFVDESRTADQIPDPGHVLVDGLNVYPFHGAVAPESWASSRIQGLVHTEAGSFADCYRLEGSGNGYLAALTYCADVGLVRYEFSCGRGSYTCHGLLELEDYRLE